MTSRTVNQTEGMVNLMTVLSTELANLRFGNEREVVETIKAGKLRRGSTELEQSFEARACQVGLMPQRLHNEAGSPNVNQKVGSTAATGINCHCQGEEVRMR